MIKELYNDSAKEGQNRLTFNCYSLKAGVYFIRISNAENILFTKKLIKNNYLVGLPVIKKSYHMDFYEYRTNDPLNVSRYGIPEPIKQKKLVPTILLIPMVAFDKNCNRLGYGGGFYDRFLEKNQNINLIKIGLAFSFQKIKKLPVNKFDKNIETMNDNPWFDYKFLIDNGWSYENGKYIKK